QNFRNAAHARQRGGGAFAGATLGRKSPQFSAAQRVAGSRDLFAGKRRQSGKSRIIGKRFIGRAAVASAQSVVGRLHAIAHLDVAVDAGRVTKKRRQRSQGRGRAHL